MTTLAPDPRAEDMLFLGMPAARRMKLNADRCVMALADSQTAITSLRQALGT